MAGPLNFRKYWVWKFSSSYTILGHLCCAEPKSQDHRCYGMFPLRCTFMRTFTYEVMSQWHEIVKIFMIISFITNFDGQYESKGIYSSKTMYYIANFSGVQPIYMWELIIPP
jgi:hypothetical protein